MRKISLKNFCLYLVLFSLLSACQFVPIAATFTPTVPPATETPPDIPVTPPPQMIQMVGVAMRVSGSAAYTPEVEAGKAITLQLDFIPSAITTTRRADGTISSTSWRPWENHPVAEMRVCIADDAPCTPSSDWQPFTTGEQVEFTVDWLGPKTFYLAAQFRDAAGNVIPSGLAYSYIDQPAALAQITLEIISRANPTTAVETLSPAIQTAQAATQQAFPVTGTVLIKDGICCAGGTAGETIDLPVAFEASSSQGNVTEMRVTLGSGCQRDAVELNAPWEPFTPTKTYQATLAINWVGFYVNVQYRDEQGNLSPVYCDDISLEGSPSQPTATP